MVAKKRWNQDNSSSSKKNNFASILRESGRIQNFAKGALQATDNNLFVLVFCCVSVLALCYCFVVIGSDVLIVLVSCFVVLVSFSHNSFAHRRKREGGKGIDARKHLYDSTIFCYQKKKKKRILQTFVAH